MNAQIQSHSPMAPSLVTTEPPCRCRNPHGEFSDGREEILFDVRSLPMIGQIGRTLAAAETLTPSQRLRQVADSICWPLLAMLEAYGCRYRIVPSGRDEAHILIWPNVDARHAGSARPRT